MTIVARQFAMMTEAGYKNYVPSCVTSFGLYVEVLETWKHDPETLAEAIRIPGVSPSDINVLLVLLNR